MTVPSTLRRAGPYATNGAQTVFSFAFKVFDEEDVVATTSVDGVDTQLTYGTEYTVSLNADQDDSPGGSVTISPALDGPTVTLTSEAAYEQPAVFTNQGGFYPRVLNDSLDRLTIFVQQLAEKVGRAALRTLGTPTPGKYLVTDADGNFTYSDGTGSDPALRTDLAGSTGATLVGLGSSNISNEIPISARRYGVVGNGVTDDTAALQALFDAGFDFVTLGRDLTINITDTVIIPHGCSVDWGGAQIVYSGTRDRPAVQIGTDSTAGSGFYRNIKIKLPANDTDWTDDDFVGLRVYNLQRTSVQVSEIRGFTRGFECRAKGFGYTLVYHYFDAVISCRYPLTRTVEGTTTSSYVNENVWFGGDFSMVTDGGGDAFCVHDRLLTGAVSPVNANVMYGPCFQPGNGDGTDARGAWLSEGGANENIICDARLEGGDGPVMVVSGPVGNGVSADQLTVGNILKLKSFSAAGGSPEFVCRQSGSAHSNWVEHTTDPSYGPDEVRFDDLVKKIKPYNANFAMMTGGMFMGNGDGVIRQIVTVNGGQIEPLRDGIFLVAGRIFGFMVDVEGEESFVLRARTLFGDQALLGVIAYDANGAQLTNASGTYPDVRGNMSGQYNWYTADHGGAYRLGSGQDAFPFSTSAAVKRLAVFAEVGKVGGLTFKRVSHAKMPMRTHSGLDASDLSHYVGGDPTGNPIGVFGRGDIAFLDTAAGAGLDAYQCTLGGRYAPDWAITTAYTVGQLRHNGGNVYEVTTPGTSAGAGGPSGTGSGIADGTVVWRYVSPRAAWTAV